MITFRFRLPGIIALKQLLIIAFVALGPIGNILTPHILPDSFRIYYFLLPFFPLFFLSGQERILKIAIFFLPFFVYSFVSAFNVEFLGSPNEPFPLFRFFLLFCQFCFVIGAASSLKSKDQLIQILKTYLNFYFISLFVGWFLFIGYYLHVVPLSLVQRFTILAQFGWGILRFSPGSYPNEYGIVSSFALSFLTLIYLDRRTCPIHFSKKWFLFLFIATFLAFLLATTRAAYLAYFVCLVYLTWKSGSFFKQFTRISIFFVTLFGILTVFNLNMFTILSSGFSQKMDQGSLGERYYAWIDGVEKAENHPLLGVGFGSLTNLHNVYLQLLFELGLVGSITLVGCVIFSFLEAFLKYRSKAFDPLSPFLDKIKMLGLINVLSFAASNHNLNHHLTWFTLFLCLAALRLPFKEEQKALG
jgi:O-antigen ligase